MVDGIQPSVEDNLQWKMTFGGRWPLVEDDLQWKTTFGRRQLSVEDNLRWKTTFGGRQPSVEDDLQWKMTLSGRRPSVDPWMLPTPLCGIFYKWMVFHYPYQLMNPISLSKSINLKAYPWFWPMKVKMRMVEYLHLKVNSMINHF